MIVKNVTMLIRFPEALVPELKDWAAEEYLSVNKLVTRILAAEVRKRRKSVIQDRDNTPIELLRNGRG